MHRLIVYRNIINDPRAELLMRLIENKNPGEFTKNYFRLCSEALNNDDVSPIEQILRLILSDENVFSICAEKGRNVSKTLKNAVLNDIRIFSDLCSIDLSGLSKKADDEFKMLGLEDKEPLRDLFISGDINEIFNYLYEYYNKNGCGVFRDNYAFTVDENLKMQPVSPFNPLGLDELFGYESQKNDITLNTERFINGLPAHNVLLFGDSGTGKSTAVKAMLPLFKDMKLRLIEVEKDKLHSLPELLTMLSGRGLYFIIFIDDLSFEHDDEEYKFLKSVIQGGLYEIARNVRFYVTSNRRNIVKQDMQARANEVNVNDFLNETISLTDRFGLKIYFDRPTKNEYIKIVKHIANRSDIHFTDETTQEAIQFAFFNGGFNGRSARQYIDSITTNGHQYIFDD